MSASKLLQQTSVLSRGLVTRARGTRFPSLTHQVRSYYETSAEPFHFIPNRLPVVCTAEEAVSCVKANDRVFLHGAAATPRVLIQALAERGKKDRSLRDIEIVSIHTEGPAEYAVEELRDVFRPNLLFIGANMRGAVNSGRADFTPVFLRDIPKLFRTGQMPIDVAFVSVSTPDSHGFCTVSF
jgi:acyl-CoA hydrolase